MNHHANHRRLRRQANGEKRGSRVQSLVDLGELNTKDKPTIATYENVGGNEPNTNKSLV
jgi:hypothetical protein